MLTGSPITYKINTIMLGNEAVPSGFVPKTLELGTYPNKVIICCANHTRYWKRSGLSLR